MSLVREEKQPNLVDSHTVKQKIMQASDTIGIVFSFLSLKELPSIIRVNKFWHKQAKSNETILYQNSFAANVTPLRQLSVKYKKIEESYSDDDENETSSEKPSVVPLHQLLLPTSMVSKQRILPPLPRKLEFCFKQPSTQQVANVFDSSSHLLTYTKYTLAWSELFLFAYCKSDKQTMVLIDMTSFEQVATWKETSNVEFVRVFVDHNSYSVFVAIPNEKILKRYHVTNIQTGANVQLVETIACDFKVKHLIFEPDHLLLLKAHDKKCYYVHKSKMYAHASKLFSKGGSLTLVKYNQEKEPVLLLQSSLKRNIIFRSEITVKHDGTLVYDMMHQLPKYREHSYDKTKSFLMDSSGLYCAAWIISDPWEETKVMDMVAQHPQVEKVKKTFKHRIYVDSRVESVAAWRDHVVTCWFTDQDEGYFIVNNVPEDYDEHRMMPTPTSHSKVLAVAPNNAFFFMNDDGKLQVYIPHK